MAVVETHKAIGMQLTPDDVATLTEMHDGVWEVQEHRAVSYPAGGLAQCAQFEDESFWFAHRNRMIQSAFQRHHISGHVLDVGGGNGFVSRMLQDHGLTVWLVEPDPAGVATAHARGVRIAIRGTLEAIQVPSASVDALGVFDVLEHVQQPLDLCREAARVVRSGGHLIMTVPACPWLWSHDDVQAGHYRRYTVPGVRHLMRSAGFEPLEVRAFFAPLVLPVFMAKSLPTRIGIRRKRTFEAAVADHQSRRGLTGSMVDWMLDREFSRAAAGRSQRVGSSLLGIGRRLA